MYININKSSVNASNDKLNLKRSEKQAKNMHQLAILLQAAFRICKDIR
jgi:hypothetical protein